MLLGPSGKGRNRRKGPFPAFSGFPRCSFQRRRNDDKNNFSEVESKGGFRRGFEKGVDRGPTLKFYCRAKAQEKQHFGKSHFYCRRFFPGNTVTIILDNYPPSTLQGVGLGGRKNPRIIVGGELLSFRRLLSLGPPDKGGTERKNGRRR